MVIFKRSTESVTATSPPPFSFPKVFGFDLCDIICRLTQ